MDSWIDRQMYLCASANHSIASTSTTPQFLIPGLAHSIFTLTQFYCNCDSPANATQPFCRFAPQCSSYYNNSNGNDKSLTITLHMCVCGSWVCVCVCVGGCVQCINTQVELHFGFLKHVSAQTCNQELPLPGLERKAEQCLAPDLSPPRQRELPLALSTVCTEYSYIYCIYIYSLCRLYIIACACIYCGLIFHTQPYS